MLGGLFVLYLVENSPSVVYNGYCKNLRTDRSFRLKVLNFYGGAGGRVRQVALVLECHGHCARPAVSLCRAGTSAEDAGAVWRGICGL
jgi:hypothetical protein